MITKSSCSIVRMDICTFDLKSFIKQYCYILLFLVQSICCEASIHKYKDKVNKIQRLKRTAVDVIDMVNTLFRHSIKDRLNLRWWGLYYKAKLLYECYSYYRDFVHISFSGEATEEYILHQN